VAKEDIYYQKGSHPVLLMKAGHSVETSSIPRLLKFGIRPEQFLLEEKPATQEVFQDAVAALPPEARVMSGLDGVELQPPPQFFQRGAKNKILIQDSDDRSIKRLTDCLTACGIPLANIHPVPVLETLFWAVEKYQPQVLFLDFTPYAFDSPTRQSLGKTMEQLKQYPCLQRILITTQLPPEQEGLRQEMLALGEYFGASVLFKPLNRFVLKEALTVPLANP
jgi:hypothetical protein